MISKIIAADILHAAHPPGMMTTILMITTGVTTEDEISIGRKIADGREEVRKDLADQEEATREDLVEDMAVEIREILTMIMAEEARVIGEINVAMKMRVMIGPAEEEDHLVKIGIRAGILPEEILVLQVEAGLPQEAVTLAIIQEQDKVGLAAAATEVEVKVQKAANARNSAPRILYMYLGFYVPMC